jgi:hypothetical protein
LLSGYDPTAWEQVFLERLNDARSTPAAYGASIGVNLSDVAPSQPLALDPVMVEADRLHSEDMNNRNYFSHTTPEGLGPGDRLSQLGVPWITWGESIAGGYTTPQDALAGLIRDSNTPDLGHRRQLLSIDGLFRDQNQLGVGIVFNGSGYYHDYYSIDTDRTGDFRPFITGVAFNDTDGNNIYDAGEGLANVTITVAGVGSTTTLASGGYSFQVNPGTYRVTASGGGLSTPLTKTVTVGSTNYRLDFNPSNFVGDSVPVEVATDIFGRQIVFAIGTDDQVYIQKFDFFGNSTGGYIRVGPGSVKAMAVGHDPLGNPELFVIAQNDAVYGMKFDVFDNPVGGYFLAASGTAKSIAVGRDILGEPELFAIRGDDQVWVVKFDPLGNPATGYIPTSYGSVQSIAVGQDASGGAPIVFAIGDDDQVYEQFFDEWGDPSSGYVLTAAGQVKSIRVGHDGFNDPELFVIGMDDQVWAQTFDASGWSTSDYFLVAVGVVQSLDVGYDAYNRPELFVIDPNGQVWSQMFDGDGTPRGGYDFTGGSQMKTVTVGQDGNGNPEIFTIGPDDQLWAQEFDEDGNPVTDYFLTHPGQIK